MYFIIKVWILLLTFPTNFAIQTEDLGPVILRRQKRTWVLGSIDITEEDEGRFPKDAVKIHHIKTAEEKLTFRLKGNGTENDLFYLDEGRNIIMVSRKIDREKTPVFRLYVSAFSATTHKKIGQDLMYEVRVKDINDNSPIFNQSKYEVEIPESTPVGKEFLRVNATDADEINNPNSQISYFFTTQKFSSYFQMNLSTGAISLKKCLNYTKMKSYTLTVSARDNGVPVLSSTTTVQINILNANDYLPTFKRTGNFLGKVKENDDNVVVLRVSVTDDDVPQTPAWRAKYKIIEGNENGNYKIETDPKTNDGILSLVKHLDFESGSKGKLNITVENEEPFYFCSEVANKQIPAPDSISVDITVENINDAPVIHPPEVTISLFENKLPDYDLVKFEATDPDNSNPENIRFAKAYDPEDWVTINDKTGVVRALRKMDRESPYVNESIYSVIIHAVDDATPPLTGTATLNIMLNDVNDNKPYLTSTYEKLCYNGETQFVTLKAKDDDMNPFGGPFKFSLLDNEPNIKELWELESKTGYSVNLLRRKAIPFGNYTIPLTVQDRQGLVQRSTLHIWVCSCPDGKRCPDPKPPTAALGVAAIVLLFAAFLLLLLGLCLIISMKRKSHFPFPAEYACGSIMKYDQEGPHVDLKLLSDKLPLNEEANLNYSGSEKDKGMTGSMMKTFRQYSANGSRTWSYRHDSEMTGCTMRTYGKYNMNDSGIRIYRHDSGMTGNMKGNFGQFMNDSRSQTSQYNSDNLAILMNFTGNYIKKKLNAYNDMQTSCEDDQLHAYNYEGEEGRRGSFDSISVGSEHGYSFLDNLDSRFTALAKICQQNGQK
ncbi:cadherin-like protein 26 isoform X1 [Hypanus sabinus]|uniref:cadherin-like protein 26 isoform X1 n=2 Tax=Hypanus sabinus TaxID=79690 RepID=UPI0028C408C1|nr:cadherin-like protein 26 isoform X1 [Hypanus sabinus]